ncbi:MAG: mechanosensitive ion channel [Gemmatimonadota bacterium]|nr:mechanosensitive ion channel [Gemmatimonadota bacterium]
MATIRPWYQDLQEALSLPLFTLGDTTVTLWSVLYLLVLILLLLWVTGIVRTLLVRALGRGGRLESGLAQAVGSMVRYAMVFIGLLIIVQTAGIDLTTLNVLAGAVGIGVGFGLQSIAANFISGLILLIGRPIKVGDRVELDGIETDGVGGEVMEIGARATTVLTNDNISIIVPNSRFVDQPVVNWSHNNRQVRFRLKVQVAYGTDVRMVEQVLLDVAKANSDVLDTPAASVRLLEFGDSGITMQLLVWSTTLIHRRGLLMSNLNFAVYDAFATQGIEIPFPQRVVHLRSPAAS